MLATQAPDRIARAASASIGRSFTGRHSRAAWTRALHPRLTARYARRTNEAIAIAAGGNK
jgi:hypothetical protein